MLPVLVVLLFAATATFAAITLTYLNTSTVTVSTIEAPVQYSAGTETSNRYVTGWTLSNNETYFTATIKGVPEVNLTIDDLFDVHNQDTAAHSVSLSIPSTVSNAQIEKFVIHFKNGATHVATWDLKTSSSINLGSMAAAAEYSAIIYIHLASGAGNNNVSESLAVTLTVT